MQKENGFPAWQRTLAFANDQIWPQLPESVRERSRALLIQLQAEVLKHEEQKKNERED